MQIYYPLLQLQFRNHIILNTPPGPHLYCLPKNHQTTETSLFLDFIPQLEPLLDMTMNTCIQTAIHQNLINTGLIAFCPGLILIHLLQYLMIDLYPVQYYQMVYHVVLSMMRKIPRSPHLLKSRTKTMKILTELLKVCSFSYIISGLSVLKIICMYFKLIIMKY